MITFVWPWMALSLIVPLLVYFTIKPSPQVRTALKAPFSFSHIPTRAQRAWLYQGLLAAFFMLLVIASARPIRLAEPIMVQSPTRDMLIALDLSGSMITQDFKIKSRPVTRLEAAVAVLQPFIESREGDRLGLILFADKAYVQTPLTRDLETIEHYLRESAVGLVGTRTALGDAIGLAIKKMVQGQAKQRILILLTDGASNAGQMEPIEAAKVARDHGIKIYTVGIGQELMVQATVLGNIQVNPSADLDEKTLRSIATMTGGQYFRAKDLAAMKNITQVINQLEPIDNADLTFQAKEELFMWPLGLSLMLLVSLWSLHRRRAFYA